MEARRTVVMDRAREHVAGGDQILSHGRWANARVQLVELADGPWVVKDFSTRNIGVRTLIGSLLVRRELAALRRCVGIPGIPADPRRIGRHALAYRYLPGRPIREAPDALLSPEVFLRFEQLVQAMHARGLVHNDLRNGRNLLVDEAGGVAIIDFQSWLDIRRLPGFLQLLLQAIDLSGVYKQWYRRLPGSLDPVRRERLDRTNRWRKLWVFRGYLGLRRHRPGEPPIGEHE